MMCKLKDNYLHISKQYFKKTGAIAEFYEGLILFMNMEYALHLIDFIPQRQLVLHHLISGS